MPDSNVLYPIPTSVPRQYSSPIAVSNSGGRGILGYLAHNKALKAASAEADKNRAQERGMSELDQKNKIALMAQQQLLAEMSKNGIINPQQMADISAVITERNIRQIKAESGGYDPAQNPNLGAASNTRAISQMTGVPVQQTVDQGKTLVGANVPGLEYGNVARGAMPYSKETESAWDFANKRQIPGSKEIGTIPGGVTPSAWLAKDRQFGIGVQQQPEEPSTANTTRIITADYSNTIFGEPTFKVSAIITTGVVNQQSFMEVEGEYAFISSSGAVLFNAVQQLKWRGKNSNFSYPFTKWLQTQDEKTIKQYRSIIFSFDNYALFGMDSILGYLYFVFDSMQGKWVGVDATAAGIIEHVTITETPTELKMYATNSKNEVWQLYADAINRETAILNTRPFFSTEVEADKDAKVRHKSQHLIVTLKNGRQAGTMNAIEYADDKLSSIALSQTLQATVSAALYPVFCPVRPSSKQLDDTKTFTWRDGLQGKKLSYVLKWDTDAELHELQLTTTEYGPDTGPAQSQQSTQFTYGA